MTKLHITTVSPSQANNLISLWHACFPADSTEYIAHFMQVLPDNTVCIVGEIESRPVTMACLIPATAKFRNAHFAVRYLYAGCTHPDARGNGYYRQLMCAAKHYVHKLGEHAIYLHPADAMLEQSYYRMGYLPGIAGRVPLYSELIRAIDYSRYLSSRQAIIQQLSKTTVIWDLPTELLAYFYHDAVKAGARIVCTDTETGICFEESGRIIESFSTTENKDTRSFCLWLPTSTSELSQYMSQHGGLTGIVGD